MRVIVTGSTTWTDEEAIRRELRLLPSETIIIHGDCQGVDAIAGRIAREELGLVVEVMAKNDEDRRRFDRLAWMGLNERMLATGADLVLAFSAEYGQPGKARGTTHMVELALYSKCRCQDVYELASVPIKQSGLNASLFSDSLIES